MSDTDKFLECIICAKPVDVWALKEVQRDEDGHIQGSYNVNGGHIRIDFGHGSRFDIIGSEFYQAHICDDCFDKVKERTRLVLPCPRTPIYAVLEKPE